MKAKTFFITLFLFWQVQPLFSQCISIELSVTWEMKNDIFNKDSLVSTPIFHISYRNNCDDNYYFFKVSPRKDGSTMILCSAMVQYEDNDYLKRAKSHSNYANQNFNVIMGEEPWYDAGWKILNDTIDYHKGNHFESVGCELEEIYKYIYAENHFKRIIKMPFDFVSSDITLENILCSVNDHFVFLKSGETFVDTYNLIGFKLVEGCFTFLIDKDVIENYVMGIHNEKLELPLVVGEYHRYSGAFNTNKVTVCFGER